MAPLHHNLDLTAGGVIEVSLNRPANVLLIDEESYDHYLTGSSYRAYGGLACRTPCRIVVPQTGKWHLLIDREFGGSAVSANVAISPH